MLSILYYKVNLTEYELSLIFHRGIIMGRLAIITIEIIIGIIVAILIIVVILIIVDLVTVVLIIVVSVIHG